MSQMINLQENIEKTSALLKHDKSDSHLSLKRQEFLMDLPLCLLPNKTQEEWKYTHDLSFLNGRYFSAPPTLCVLDSTWVKDFFTISPYRLVMVDGHFSKDQSNLPKGITISQNSNEEDHKKVQFQNYYRFFDQINFISTQEHLKINVSKDFYSKEPLLILHLQTSFSNKHTAGARVDLKLEKNANLDLVIWDTQVQTEVDKSNTLSSFNLNALLEDNAQLMTASRHDGSWDKKLFANFHYNLSGNDSKITHLCVSDKTSLARIDTTIIETGSNTESNYRSLYKVPHKGHHDHFLSIFHQSPNTSSNSLIKGIILDEGQGVFTGKIDIAYQAQKTNAQLLNKNLLLGEKAKVETRPQLEVFADDVKASHGATIGKLNPEEVFYLQTRGISRDRANALLQAGFAHEVFDDLKNEKVKHFLKEGQGRNQHD